MIKINNKFLNKLILILGTFVIFSQLSCKPYKESNKLIVAGAGRITSVDPSQASTFQAIQLISTLGDPLYRINRDGKLIPVLASQQPQKSKDGLSLYISLRKNVLFHDGTPFNAEAMVFSIRRFMRIGATNYVINNRISSLEVINPYLIAIKLSRPSISITGLLTSINLTPVSPTAYENHKNKYLNNHFVGTGPYLLKKFNANHQSLEPYKDYWGEASANDGINFISLSNSTSLVVALLSKEIDILLSNSIDETQSKFLHAKAKQGQIKESKGPALEIGFISLNTTSKTLKDPLMREALSLTIDRELISNRVSYGFKKPLRSIVPPILKEEVHSPWQSYNPRKAKYLLRESGYCQNKKAIIPLTFRSNVPADKLFALSWKEQIDRDFSECLELELNSMESTTVYKQLEEGTFDAVILDWRGAYPDPEAYLTPLLSCTKILDSICKEGEAISSGTFWGSKKLQEALINSDKEDGLNRLNYLKEVENYASKGNPYIPLWLITPKAWGQSNITQPEFDGSGHLLLNKLRTVKP